MGNEHTTPDKCSFGSWVTYCYEVTSVRLREGGENKTGWTREQVINWKKVGFQVSCEALLINLLNLREHFNMVAQHGEFGLCRHKRPPAQYSHFTLIVDPQACYRQLRCRWTRIENLQASWNVFNAFQNMFIKWQSQVIRIIYYFNN